MHTKIPFTKLTTLLLLTLFAFTTPQSKADGVLCSLRSTLSTSLNGLGIFDIAIVDTVAYVLEANHGLQIIDVTDPKLPLLLGSYDTPVWASRIFVKNNLAYIANLEAGLIILDISDSNNPIHVSTFKDSLSFKYFDVVVRNSIAYVADGFYGLIVLDVTDPTKPTRIGSYNTSGWAVDIEVDGSVVYLSDSANGLQILDVSNLSTPVRITSIPTDSSTQNTIFFNNSIYIADGYAGLKVYDVSDPSTPLLQESLELTGFVHAIALEEPTLYVSDLTAGIVVFDISNQNSPVEMGTYSSYSMNPEQFVVLNSVAYIANNDRGLLILDVGSPGPSPLISTILYSDRVTVRTDDSFAYFKSGQVMNIYDVSDPRNLNLISSFLLNGSTFDWTVSDSIVYVASGWEGIQLIDVSDPNQPHLLSSIMTPGFSRDVVVSGSMAYVSDTSSLQIIDVSNPSKPFLRGSVLSMGVATAIEIQENKVYLTNRDTGIMIVDVSNPDSPSLLATYTGFPFSTDIEVVDNFIHLLDGSGGFRILDASIPSDIEQLAYLEMVPDPAMLSSITIQDDSAYITMNYRGLAIVDISNPMFPITLARQETLNGAVTSSVKGDFAFVTGQINNDWNLQIFDISDCPPCPADLNNDTVINFADISAFLIAYGNQDPAADFAQDGFYNFADISAFLNAYAAGCS